MAIWPQLQPADGQPGAQSAAAAQPDLPEILADAPWLRRLPLQSPTLPPAAHTNLYVVGEGELLVVDPGTPYPDELARLHAALAPLVAEGRRVTGVFLTHHHFDHASGAAALREALGVPIFAHPVTAARVGERLGLAVDRLVEEGERLPYGPSGLAALHTPGHAPGHLCLLDEASGGLLAGDMVASVGTILVDPADDGDMALYLASLRRLLARAESAPLRLWPAHGVSVPDGAGLLQRYIAHRLLRESKVLAALAQLGAPTFAALLPAVYDDVAPGLLAVAAGSLRAHLDKLRGEGRVTEDAAGRWIRSA